MTSRSTTASTWADLDAHLRRALDAPDALHKARVATRRLRELVAIEGAPLATETARKTRKRLRDVGRILGTVRELHVAQETLEEIAQDANGAPDAIARVRRQLDATYAVRRATAIHDLPVATRRLERARAHWLASMDAPSGAGDKGLSARIGQRANSLSALLPLGDQSPATTLHTVRIAAKKLRYCLEEALHRDYAGARWIERLLALMQQTLGRLQEREVLRPFVRQAHDEADASAAERVALQELLVALERQTAALRAEFHEMQPALAAAFVAASGPIDALRQDSGNQSAGLPGLV